MDLIWISAHVWLISLASVGSFIMFLKQLLQQSNAGNVLGFACNESNACKDDNEKIRTGLIKGIAQDCLKDSGLIIMVFQDVGNYADLWPYKPFLIEMKAFSEFILFFISMFRLTRTDHLHCGPKMTHNDICGCMDNLKNVTEMCVNRIPEQATSTSAAKQYLEHSPISQNHSEQQTGCCGANQGGKSEQPFQMFGSLVDVDLTGLSGI
jgi:hypothetical protein